MRDRALLLILLAYALAVGLQLSGFEAVWDARTLLTAPDQRGLLEQLAAAWTQDFWLSIEGVDAHASGMYRPIVATHFALARWLGLGAFAAHLVNLGLHLAAAWMAGRLALRLGGEPVLATLLVLVHPHVSGLLGDIAACSDLYATVFVLGALLLRERHAWPAAGLLLLGCLSKEVAFTGVALWVLLDLVQGRREPRTWLAPLLAVVLGLALRVAVVGLPGGSGGGLDPLGALVSTGWAYVDLVLPLEAGPWAAPRESWPGWAGLLAALGIGAIQPWSVAWVAMSWAPMAGWLPLEVRLSRALLYLPMVGLALGAARLPQAQRWGWALLLVLPLQMLRIENWRDPDTLWTWAAEYNAESPLVWTNRGRVAAEAEDYALAREHYLRAAGLAQEQRDATFFVKSTTALGRLALIEGQPEQARVYLEDAIKVGGPKGAAEAAGLLAGLP